MAEVSVLDPELKAKYLLEILLRGKQVHDLFAKSMKEKLLISGRTIEEWETEFKIKVPTDNLTPAMCKQIDIKLMELNQEASFFHAVATAKLQMIKRGGESAFRDRYFALVQEYKDKKKLPAAATLENLAKVENDDIESAQSIAEVEKGFWVNILDHLSSCRKIIENATFNSSIEAKTFLQSNR